MDIEKIIREYLPGVVHLSLGTSKDNKPWVCEVHYAYDDGLHLYFRSLTTRRHSQEIAANPHVAGNIVRQHAPTEYPPRGVYFEGTAELLAPGEGQTIACECIKKRLGITADILAEAQAAEGNQFYKITVAKWYVFGKFDEGEPCPQKYELVWHAAAPQ